jgi:hypothetical protein
MGRTRTNKIVVFPPSPKLPRISEADDELVGELVDIRIERANGFSLYGRSILRADATFSVASATSKVQGSPAVRRPEFAVPDLRDQ